MKDKLIEIDAAMNMIKEEIIQELSDAVSKQNKKVLFQELSSNKLTFSERAMD